MDKIADMSMGASLNRMAGVVDKKAHARKPTNELDKEAFMKMLMEQIKYQDPFNPVKNEQFSQQLTAMSSLEQQVNMNKNIEKMISHQNNQHIAALQVVGKSVIANKGTIYHEKDTSPELNFELPAVAEEVKIRVFNPAGKELASFDIGTQPEGKIATRWDGLYGSGIPAPSGRYNFKVEAIDRRGQPIDVKDKIEGRVTGVTSQEGKVYLLVGSQKVDLNDVESINEVKEEEKVAKQQPPAQAGAVASAPGAPPKPADVNPSQKADEKTASASGTDRESISEAERNRQRLNELLPMIYR